MERHKTKLLFIETIDTSIKYRYNSYIEVRGMAYRGEQKIKGKTYVYQAVAEWNLS